MYKIQHHVIIFLLLAMFILGLTYTSFPITRTFAQLQPSILTKPEITTYAQVGPSQFEQQPQLQPLQQEKQQGLKYELQQVQLQQQQQRLPTTKALQQMQQQLQQRLQQQQQLLPQLQQQLQKQQPQLQPQQQEEKQQIMLELQRLQKQQQQQQLLPTTTEEEDDDDVPSLNDIWKILPDLKLKALGATTANQTSTTALNQAPQFQAITAPRPPIQQLNPPNLAQPLPDNADPISRGCFPAPGAALPTRPEWVSVKPYPYDTVEAKGEITQSLDVVNHHEWPFSHHSHDNTPHIALDPKYVGLASKNNGMTGGTWKIEMESEIGTANTGITDRFPKEFWPWEGDRVWTLGHWVWDCGHFDPVHLNGWRSEIHPPYATAFTRNEPYQFPGEGKPSSATVTYIYIHGRGGSISTPVGGQNYEFDIPTPPKPSFLPTTQLRYSVIGLPFAGPAPIVTPKSQLCDFAGKMTICAHVVIPLSGIPASTTLKYGAIVAAKWIDTTRPLPSTEGFRKLRVTFDSIKINQDHESDSKICNRRVCTPIRAPGEWDNLWVGVNGKWIELSGPSGNYGLHGVYSGQVKVFPTGQKFVDVIVPESGELKIQTTGWEDDNDGYYGHSYLYYLALPLWLPVGPSQLGALDDNDEIGVLRHYYCSVRTEQNKDRCDEGNFGIRPHDERSNFASGESGTSDFNLRYRIEQLGIIPPSTTLPSTSTTHPLPSTSTTTQPNSQSGQPTHTQPSGPSPKTTTIPPACYRYHINCPKEMDSP